jgi:hypothetical protein
MIVKERVRAKFYICWGKGDNNETKKYQSEGQIGSKSHEGSKSRMSIQKYDMALIWVIKFAE